MSVRRYLSSDGVHLAYEEWTGSGPTLVFCHGLAATGEQFAEDAAFFAARGHHVLVPHLRGHGLSEGPAVPTAESLSISRLAADLVDMLDHAGTSRVHWVGNSLGGIVALQMLASRRFHSLATFGTTYAIRLPRLGGHRLIGAAHRMVGAGRMAALTARLTSRHADARRLIEKMLREVRIETAERRNAANHARTSALPARRPSHGRPCGQPRRPGRIPRRPHRILGVTPALER
jgi:3-oxoadipate enol-lactonase